MKMLKKPVYGILMISLLACNKTETVQPKKVDIIDAIFASGYIISDSEYAVTANTEGYLLHSFVEEGDHVRSGMSLFHLSNDVQSEQLSNAQVVYQDALRKLNHNSPEIGQLEVQIEQAYSQLELDKKNYKRYKKLLEINAVSQLEFDKIELQYENAKLNVEVKEKALEDLVNSLKLNVKNAESQLKIQKENNEDYFLSSRIDGRVLKVYKKPGELVKRGELVAKIGGGQKLAKLFVAEDDINKITVDQEVILSLNTDKSKTYEGFVSKILPAFDEQEQSFIIEAKFNKVPTKLYYNTQLQANIIIGLKKDSMVIPAQYLTNGDSILIKGGNARNVEVGVRNEEWVEIIEGVDPSDILIKPEEL